MQKWSLWEPLETETVQFSLSTQVFCRGTRSRCSESDFFSLGKSRQSSGSEVIQSYYVEKNAARTNLYSKLLTWFLQPPLCQQRMTGKVYIEIQKEHRGWWCGIPGAADACSTHIPYEFCFMSHLLYFQSLIMPGKAAIGIASVWPLSPTWKTQMKLLASAYPSPGCSDHRRSDRSLSLASSCLFPHLCVFLPS